MVEGLKLANDIFERMQETHSSHPCIYAGILATILMLMEPENADLWKRIRTYIDGEADE